MLSYIDHVTIAVRDLDASIRRFRERLSFFVSSKRGEPSSSMANAVIPFLQGYLELLSLVSTPACKPVAPEAQPRRLNAFLAAREGLFSFAILSSNLEEDIALLRDRGSTLPPPVRHEPTGPSIIPAWWTTSIAGDDGHLFPELIQYADAPGDRVRQAALTQPYAIRSIEEVTIIVDDLERALEGYERDFGLRATRTRGGVAQIALTASKINLVPARQSPLGVPVGLYSVALGTTDITGAKQQLADREVDQRVDPLTWAVSTQIDTRVTFDAAIDIVQT